MTEGHSAGTGKVGERDYNVKLNGSPIAGDELTAGGFRNLAP
jgi:hypothetical protein